MTTRFELELQAIEADLRNPAKAGKITPALREHVRVQRQREKDRDIRTPKLGTEIVCQWVTGEPKNWDVATAQIRFGGHTNAITIAPYRKIDGELQLDPKLARKGYDKMVEEWAMWKWHTARGSEVDDNDNYIVDCELPAIVWEEPTAAEPKKRATRKVTA